MEDSFDSMVQEMTDVSAKSETEKKTEGRNSRSEVFEYGYHFDSKEELDVYEWISEAVDLGFVDSFEYQPDSFVLYDGFKNKKDKYVVRPHVYTADFKICFSDKWIEFRKHNNLKIFDKFDEKCVFIDVKGQFSIYDDGRSFQINSKWMLSKYGIYIWKIIPMKFFEKTWLPKKCVLTRKTKKLSKKYGSILTFESKFSQAVSPK